MEMETVSHICLGALLGVVIVYFILENSVLDNYVRFLLTPYLGNTAAATLNELTKPLTFPHLFQL